MQRVALVRQQQLILVDLCERADIEGHTDTLFSILRVPMKKDAKRKNTGNLGCLGLTVIGNVTNR